MGLLIRLFIRVSPRSSENLWTPSPLGFEESLCVSETGRIGTVGPGGQKKPQPAGQV